MESIIFDYIGYVFAFCAALCVVAPVLVYLVNIVVGSVWQVIDEGDSNAPDLLKKAMPFLFTKGKIVKRGSIFVIVDSAGRCYDPSDGGFWVENFSNIKTIDEANFILKSIPPSFCFYFISMAFATFSLLSIGFTLTPTITMYALSSALCLFSLRWSRRGYKKVKKLKVALDEHAKNRDAHK
tara:strand:+ start:70 stop:615 length:546 start_codon:yes stop_codon:yes gene_type:complete